MNPDIKNEWIRRLESGEYPQCKGTMHRISGDAGDAIGYCCLGVLSEMAVEAGVIKKKERVKMLSQIVEAYDGITPILPTSVVKWAELPSETCEFAIKEIEDDIDLTIMERTKNFRQTALSELNDSGATFEEIAKVIRKYF